MSELSRSLVDAAAEADWQAHNAEILKVIGKRISVEEKKRQVSQARSSAVLAAVLETLAADVEVENQPSMLVDYTSGGKHYREGKSYVVGLMRRLAVEARTES